MGKIGPSPLTTEAAACMVFLQAVDIVLTCCVPTCCDLETEWEETPEEEYLRKNCKKMFDVKKILEAVEARWPRCARY